MSTSSTANSRTARLIEVFSAIQGEGQNVGTRQIFIRFAQCDLRCHFCDSVHTWEVPESCRIERSPGERDFETHVNPVTQEHLLQWVQRQHQPGLHDSISLTGGEPLLHASFLQSFLPLVRQQTSLPVYLETGGHRPQQLRQILTHLDSIGMDLKLPSVSGETWWQAHRQCLQAAHSAGVEVFVKIIIAAQTDLTDLLQAAQLVAAVSPEIPVFLQPVTPLEQLHPKQVPLAVPRPDQVLAWQSLLKQTLQWVRVIPQTHKMIAQL
ncbi:radical SAM protein [Neosynechococcus sphagnicola sy1]|uniref:7-carboxy-7-deazaguanine synthase n=1 Tax=Neosynechococcus sphagnicola sy1 TaxID=1497020 RepID=A0A098TPA2_9CYAN|nr:7-carboxy-7-deazaguanine synthase QueE [Neosynechococcus sphagnicola]KGF73717.1 radical SAM protein [Neosynechococcus sphagnicola sy1]